MANIERIEAAIRVMENAKALDMRSWQSFAHLRDPRKEDIEELHACGNTACFAGYIAISKEFREAGGTVGTLGFPVYFEFATYLAIAKYFDISNNLARNLVYGDDFAVEPYSRFYSKPFSDVKPADVIEKLEMILRGELQ